MLNKRTNCLVRMIPLKDRARESHLEELFFRAVLTNSKTNPTSYICKRMIIDEHPEMRTGNIIRPFAQENAACSFRCCKVYQFKFIVSLYL